MTEDEPIINEISSIRRDWSASRTLDYIHALPIWRGSVVVEQLFGGLQNRTYVARVPAGPRFAVRVGFDQYRTRQTTVVQCTIAAHKLGLGPRLVYAEPNLTVTEWVEGKRMELDQMKDRSVLEHIIERMKILHEGSWAVGETISYWWPFDTIRRYLRSMEVGKRATGFTPSKWGQLVPEYRAITNRLEKVIAPFHPKLTHNDLGFVNMIFGPDQNVMFIDWDGGGYGHPMWDLGEMLMWAEADDETVRFALSRYFGRLSRSEFEQRLREVHALQIMSALRLIVEVMETDLDPYFYLSPEEMTESMKIILPDRKPELTGIIDELLPRFETYRKAYEREFPQE
jgi:thiamine kinase-like enzyme